MEAFARLAQHLIDEGAWLLEMESAETVDINIKSSSEYLDLGTSKAVFERCLFEGFYKLSLLPSENLLSPPPASAALVTLLPAHWCPQAEASSVLLLMDPGGSATLP